ncbi:MAG: UbiH/UbiF/VisC/COQ6 family ubiquinone biosynthesis hydroxylase [Magnetovibrio sp.]|nr:UbiH/UbiF/VisC/COQ6 family ubiquinone biosynthesis hydroxylase [Magnetovibrio sp.]
MTTTPRTSTAHKADVLVIGGGLAGGTLSLALAQNGFVVATVDREDLAGWTDQGFDGRASAISLSSRRVLQGVGIWDVIAEETAPMLDIRVCDGHSPLFLHYDHKELASATLAEGQEAEPFGYMVENRSMRKALTALVPKTENLTYFAPNEVAQLERSKDGVRAVLKGGQEIHADLVVACEGRNSPTRDQAGIKLTQWDYKQAGIVCTVEHERPHNFCAQEHFLPSGPFAILPLVGTTDKPACRSSIVWTERADLWPIIMELDDDDFKEELELRFGDFLGDIEVVGPRFAYPLTLQYADTIIAQRLALVADSAHGMHPIAGQGLNMGLRDVAALAEVLVNARGTGLDIGEMSVLQNYERWRRFDNAVMLGVTDALVKLFSNDIEPVKLARDLGMAAVNQLPDVKRFFMRHAMGTVGELPRLMRGESLRP